MGPLGGEVDEAASPLSAFECATTWTPRHPPLLKRIRSYPGSVSALVTATYGRAVGRQSSRRSDSLGSTSRSEHHTAAEHQCARAYHLRRAGRRDCEQALRCSIWYG